MTEVVWSNVPSYRTTRELLGNLQCFLIWDDRSMQHQLLWSKKKKTILEMYTHNKSKGEH